MGRGDFFGYSALLANAPSPMSVSAADDLEVLILETDAVQKMLNKSPRFAQQLSAVIAARQSRLKEIDLAQAKSGTLLSSLTE
ncbi:MAG: Crp/Fnr family transcriptional regulator [Phormidesmis sp. RL_2_1]|nr:Crp/Fnr family transcriptional regulator [Phormidesmis sp. RL_2_1]